MRVYRDTFKGSDGERQKCPRWTVEIRDHRDRPRRLVAFKDKRASEELGRKLERLAAARMAGDQLDTAMMRWLGGLPNRLREKLARIGLLDTRTVTACKLLGKHLVDYRQALLDRGNTRKHADMTTDRVQAVLTGIKAGFVSEVSATAVSRYLAERRALPKSRGGLSIASSNHYLVAIKGFCRWMVAERRIAESPVGHLMKLNERLDRRRVRRALSESELAKLITATFDAPKRYGMTGPERAMAYRFAAETGLRASEIRSLTLASFELDGNPPTVTVAAAYSKHRRDDTLLLRPSMAAELKGPFAAKLPGIPAFLLPEKAARMLRADLQGAGIAYRDDAGRVFDFHALRHQFASNLAAGGVHPKEAQELMRHSKIDLTMSTYTHVHRGKLTEALDMLPDLSYRPDRETARATGTDDIRPDDPAVYSARHSARKGTQQVTSVQQDSATPTKTDEVRASRNPLKTVISDDSQGVSTIEAGGAGTHDLRTFNPPRRSARLQTVSSYTAGGI